MSKINIQQILIQKPDKIKWLDNWKIQFSLWGHRITTLNPRLGMPQVLVQKPEILQEIMET